MDLNALRLIGVVHLKPLPGSPGWAGSMDDVASSALHDAVACAEGGCDALIIENFGDVPFTRGSVPAETVAAMASVAIRIADAVDIPIGFNVLRNDAASALALCAACNGSFIRVNVHTGAMLTDQGLIQGDAFGTLRLRERLCPSAKIIADVMVKHAAPLADIPLDVAAEDTIKRGQADALVLSGEQTGAPTDPGDLAAVRDRLPNTPILVGSGSTLENAAELLQHASGLIIGTALKKDGNVANPVDPDRVKKLATTIAAL